MSNISFRMETTRLKFEEICWKKGNYTTKEYQSQSQMPIQLVQRCVDIVEARKQITDKEIANNKKDDLRSMPLVDQQYHKSIGIE